MREKKGAFGAISFIIASTIVLSGCGSEEPKKKLEEREVPVEVTEVTYGVLKDSNLLTGTIEAESKVSILPKAAGEITKIHVKKGDFVKKGDVLAQLDDTAEQNVVKQQQASLESAQNAKTKAQSSYDQAVLSLNSAEIALEQAGISQEDNINNIDIQLKNAENNWKTAKKNLERMQALYDEGLISLQEYENAKNNESSAKNALDQTKLSKTQTSREINLKPQESAVEQAKINLAIAEASLTDAEIGITQAQIALESAMDRLDDKIIKATISGEVTEIINKVGEMASNASPFASIVATETVILDVNISSNLLPSFTVGKEIDVKVTGSDDTFKGKVDYISTVSSGYGLFTVEIKINNKDKIIRPGMIASLIIEEVKEDNSIIVPADAVVHKEGKDVVFIISDGKAVMKEVEVGLSNVEFTSLAGELKEKDLIVISGQNLLKDGNKVTIMEED
ncbi:efflux RND transporter periplasmic adaptor subunit [Lysinibacillus antri]|uniref:Efflux RND transporter periplasmic adaptor subunit n=1 Tax=Lysinibacillus antri TaxID=2498145 RepID=A0A432L995_9BACI|nr:efflux RND transporter periplasmic adaptor subunit [Lysinibacillus antri]RUL49802.1 efflux RND transporter periplasmic adaptor subunit [Lysinibacillus antri]